MTGNVENAVFILGVFMLMASTWYAIEKSRQSTELKERVGELRKKLNEKTISYGEISAVLTPAANRPDLGCRVQAKMLVDRVEAAEAQVKDLETQLAGRTYCHSDEAVEAKLKKCEDIAKAKIEYAFAQGYGYGHNDTVDGQFGDAGEIAKDWFIDATEDGSIEDAVKELNSEEI
jgi:hypothetical protein